MATDNVDDVDRHDSRPGDIGPGSERNATVEPGPPPPDEPGSAPDGLNLERPAAEFTSEVLPPVRGINNPPGDEPT